MPMDLDLYPCEKMTCDEIFKAVFPLLDGVDLASCMLVSRQWKDIAQDDYLWKCLCARRWPSIGKRPPPSTMTYYQLFRTFYRRERTRTLLPPRLSFDDIEFYIDIWAESELIYSEVVSGTVLQAGIKEPPAGVSDLLKYRLQGPEYKMAIPVEPKLCVHYGQLIKISVLANRKDCDKFACIINKGVFDYFDRTSCRALAYDFLDISPLHPFIPGIRAWISLLLNDDGNGSDGVHNVFGIVLDFCDAANSEEEVLWLLDMLNWK